MREGRSAAGREAQTPPLSAPLSVILPTPSETALLRACLLTGLEGRGAWDVWRREPPGVEGVTTLPASLRGLIPLIQRAVTRNAIAVEGTTGAVLRAGYLHEELRRNTYRSICAEVLSALDTENIPVIVLGGAALAEGVYEDAALRHCHDVDLLVHQRDLEHAAGVLRGRGFVGSRETGAATTSDRTIVHASGLPVELHSRLLAIPWYPVPLTEIWARARRRDVAGMPAHVLSPADALLYACAHASYSARRVTLRWVCDSWFILHRHRELDWDVFVRCAVRSHLALPLSVTLSYLSREIGVPVPAGVLDRIYVAATQTDRIRREVALRSARESARGSLRTLVRTSGSWRARGAVIRWLLCPSAAYIRWVEPVRRWWELPLRYVQRPARYVLRRLRQQLTLV
jgi:hypothetical protein